MHERRQGIGRSAMVLVRCVAATVIAACAPPTTPPDRGVVVGSTSVDIDTRSTAVRVGEAPVANFLTDTLRDAPLGEPVELALLNAGSIRGGQTTSDSVPVDIEAKLGRVYPAGPLTDADILGWDPFRDDHVVMTLSGAQLKSALERGAAQLPPDLRVDGGGPLLHPSGGRYTIDCAGSVQILDVARAKVAREGTRVTRLEVGGRLLYDQQAGVDELATARVRLVVNDFVARGFDGHVAFAGGSDARFIPFEEFDVAHAAVDRVRAASPIAPAVDGRISVIGDCGRPLTLP